MSTAAAGTAAAGAAGAGFGAEGGDNASALGFGATTTTTTSTVGQAGASVVGLPSVPSNQLASTINPGFLPGPYISRVVDNPNEVVEN